MSGARDARRQPTHHHWTRGCAPRPALIPALILSLFWAIGLFATTGSVAEEEFLQPDQAFRISGSAAGADSVTVSWDIEPGYYMYRSKFRFASESPGIAVGSADLPPAETKQDEFFGEVQIYRDRVEATLPVERGADSGDVVAIEAKSQGCADAGLCYPPQKQRILLELPKLAAVADAAPTAPLAEPVSPPAPQSLAQALTGGGQSMGFGMEDDILPAEEAFQLTAAVDGPDRLALSWQVAPGTYLYQEKIELSLEGADEVQIGTFELPEAEIKPDTVRPDGTIGDVAIYHGQVDVEVPLLRGDASPTTATLVAKFQGCADRGICYPPVTERVTGVDIVKEMLRIASGRKLRYSQEDIFRNFDFGDIFREFGFGGRGFSTGDGGFRFTFGGGSPFGGKSPRQAAPKGSDLVYELPLTLQEVASGVQ